MLVIELLCMSGRTLLPAIQICTVCTNAHNFPEKEKGNAPLVVRAYPSLILMKWSLLSTVKG